MYILSNCNSTSNLTNKNEDEKALIYILVVISIFVFSLAFFFIKSLKRDSEISSYQDDLTQRGISNRKQLVEQMRERLRASEKLTYNQVTLSSESESQPLVNSVTGIIAE